ncbi:uncharacterized protein ARMOST_10960 [Armillaria ostoyae]|uniref:RlpA-like protein double-psi beta-barrel domain-containing protein n=1 Tax=Armillaria ostoyae TaxID=47428 RepID=A0A284RFT3_ARMOS|nr:uncharacterized protein ARMOST_10960 [Armillaria ostoyae]
MAVSGLAVRPCRMSTTLSHSPATDMLEGCTAGSTSVYSGKFVDVTIGDLCPDCGRNEIDLSRSAFQKLAALDDGRINVTWNFYE